MMYHVVLIVGLATVAVGDDLPPSCSKPVYCDSALLHHVQLARIFSDSKTFVDLQLKNDAETTLNAFDQLLNETQDNPSKQQLEDFVNQHFNNTGELQNWIPPDLQESPEFLKKIKDEELRNFAKSINDIWPKLARKIKPIVFEKPELFSLVPVTHGFIIPGGRFKEIYYWDTYWIIEGLLISGMMETAKGMIENLIELLNKFGHIPNGSRWYYEERSQPPLLTAMVMLYYRKTKDVEFLRKNIASLEKEMNYWLDTQIVTFRKDDRIFTMLRYYAPSAGPRPESYAEDYEAAQYFGSPEVKTEFFVDIKSAAESGWDFSSRWFINKDGCNSGNLTDTHTRDIVPVDQNAIFAGALRDVTEIYTILKNPRRAAHWGFKAEQWRANIEAVLWNERDGIWYDYDILNEKPRKYFYTSNMAPLWMRVVNPALILKHAPKIVQYLKKSTGLDFPGGVPVSLDRTGEQWDFPNVWPPEVSIVIKGLEALNTTESSKLAFHIAQQWVRVNLKGFKENNQMFEKYDAENPGKYGSGGEYTVQEGFGWSNGLVLECLDTYGETMTAEDSFDVEDEIPSSSNRVSAGSQPADNAATTFDSLGVVPLVLGGNYVKSVVWT